MYGLNMASLKTSLGHSIAKSVFNIMTKEKTLNLKSSLTVEMNHLLF